MALIWIDRLDVAPEPWRELRGRGAGFYVAPLLPLQFEEDVEEINAKITEARGRVWEQWPAADKPSPRSCAAVRTSPSRTARSTDTMASRSGA